MAEQRISLGQCYQQNQLNRSRLGMVVYEMSIPSIHVYPVYLLILCIEVGDLSCKLTYFQQSRIAIGFPTWLVNGSCPLRDLLVQKDPGWTISIGGIPGPLVALRRLMAHPVGCLHPLCLHPLFGCQSCSNLQHVSRRQASTTWLANTCTLFAANTCRNMRRPTFFQSMFWMHLCSFW